MKGDDYIFYSHPSDQKTPKADRLRHWYVALIQDSIKEGVVVERGNLFDEYMDMGKPGDDILEVIDIYNTTVVQ